ncbi:hypothetical protein PPERSA_12182 [Pseudocohnilembus persalinus]|uniref:Uncharacterized protein n=1 Tax=Pseudocohnilembus persalinus TaxID=266149 RepID=A0A0V0R8M3_PSEPJ|nr:hypothetical protein PPERSA_12182 [Pseudocohnilembus persalinus]|eukprot:KRX10831.1 hypothetical protein PPERSA_12182 [Pseudocohnilembus persalinus]
MKCKKQGHQCLEASYLNLSSENKEDFFFCPICIQYILTDKKKIFQKEEKTLLIEQLKNDQVSSENTVGWPPIQDENHQKIYKNHAEILKEFGQENEQIQKQQKEAIIQLENYCNNNFQDQNLNQEFINTAELMNKFDVKYFREKFQEFQQNKIDVDQLFDYKQQQNKNVYNNQEIYDSLQNQQQKVEELQQKLEKEFTKMNESIDAFKKYQPNIQIIMKQQQQPQKQQQQQLKFYKSDYGQDSNQGKFEVDNDARTIKFKTSNYYTYIYSENLQQQKEYHLRFTMDTKNKQKNIYLVFSLTSADQKNSKDLRTDHCVWVFNHNSNSSAKGGDFQVEGKKNLCEFFKDNLTIMNVVFNIEKKMMEIYDDDRVSYQRLNFNNNNKNFDEWIFGITYGLDNNISEEVSIQFID